MSDPAYALQDAIHDALKGATDAGNNVFDSVPHSNPFPRITIGPQQTIGDFADCYDGSEVFLQIDVWSQKPGYPQVKEIASQVRDILHNADETLTLDGHVLGLMEFQDTVYSREPDQKTSRARINIRALTQTEDPASP